ncbi:hypothetical protein ACLKA7_006031 [Drosophila subpalustris]
MIVTLREYHVKSKLPRRQNICLPAKDEKSAQIDGTLPGRSRNKLIGWDDGWLGRVDLAKREDRDRLQVAHASGTRCTLCHFQVAGGRCKRIGVVTSVEFYSLRVKFNLCLV